MNVLTALSAQLDLWLDRFDVFFATEPADVQGCLDVLEEVRRKELNRVAGGSVLASHALDAKGDLRLAACRDSKNGKIIGCMRITPALAAKHEPESIAEYRLDLFDDALLAKMLIFTRLCILKEHRKTIASFGLFSKSFKARCDEGCTAACGCCGCADGSEEPVAGGVNRCTGGCYVFVPTKPCGGLAGAACAADEWCDLPNGCGSPDAQGTCKKRPDGCFEDCPGVCGCDGKQYCNTCIANTPGGDTSDDKSCLAGKPCDTHNECPSGVKSGSPSGIPGCQNQCTVPDASGACPMYP